MAGWYRFSILGFMISMPLLGAVNILITKAFDIQHIAGENFFHPYFQTFSMFLAEGTGYFAYLLLFRQKHLREIHKPEFIAKTKNVPSPCVFVKKLGKFVFGIPALLDICASTLLYLGVYLTESSVFQMLSGCLVISTALFSMLVLRKKLFRHQIIGIFTISLGIVLVGFLSLFWKTSIAKDSILGVIFLTMAHLMSGCQFVVEEKYLRNVIIHPMEVVAIEGVVGTLVYILLLISFQYIPCNYSQICTHGHIEDTIAAVENLTENKLLLGLWMANLVVIVLFNWTGVSVTKYASSLARATMDICRTVLIWIVSISIGMEDFLWIELIGVICLLLGIIIYNEIIALPSCFYNRSSYIHKPTEKLLGCSFHSESNSTKSVRNELDSSKINETMESSDTIV